MILTAWILTIIFGTLALGSVATLLLHEEVDSCKEKIRLFAEAMESDLTDNEKADIINDLYEIMDIWRSALDI